MENLPLYISVFFGLTVLLGILLFYKVTNYSKSFLLIILSWITLQTMISLSGFYRITNTVPPHFGLLVLPTLIFISVLFATKKGRKFIDDLDLKMLTLFSLIRIPVEIVLFCLFIYKTIPALMIFEGRNFDILSGISAPLLYYFVFVKKSVSKNLLLLWNFVCLGLLLNVVFYALLSVPSVLQQFAFDQPNIAILYFPFVLLPSCLVPLVLLSHLAAIRQLLKK